MAQAVTLALLPLLRAPVGRIDMFSGTVDARFRPVEDVFRENFAKRDEVGAAIAVYLEGKKVVDLWGGIADPGSGRPWSEDTLQLVFSTTKGLTALCLAILVDRGLLDYDQSVAACWPEFAQAGKGSITLRQLLNHQAGLAAIDEPMSLDTLSDPDMLARHLAAQRPLWEPGTAIGYHALALGWYGGEVVRRVTGRTLGRFFAGEVAGPLDAECYIGLPDALAPRVTTTIPAVQPPHFAETDPLARAARDRSSLTSRAFANPADLTGDPTWFNRPLIHRLEIPAANGICTARGLARIYSVLAVGGSQGKLRLVGGDVLRAAMSEGARGDDLITRWPQCYSVGFMKPYGAHPYSIHAESFGHPGAGGSVAFADPVSGLGFAYVMNRMGPHSRLDDRTAALVEALYACA